MRKSRSTHAQILSILKQAEERLISEVRKEVIEGKW